MKTYKGTRILILSLVVILLTSAFSLAIINLWVSNKSKEDTIMDANVTARATTWNFDNGPVTGNHEYAHDFGVYEQDYNVFEIGSLQAFENFETSMGEGGRVGRCDFSGKTIKLTANIDCGGKTFNFGWEDTVTSAVGLSFHGTFDGQGYTISNMHASPDMGDMGHRYGMFRAISGTLKNTTFRNFEYYCAGGDDDTGHYGIIAGLNSGTIENCIVDNCKFTSDRFKSNCRVAPIAGQNSGTIKNCIVKGIYTIGGNDGNGPLNDDGLYAHYFVTTGNESKYCVFDATVKKTGVTSELYAPASHDTALSSGNYNYNSYTSAYTNFPSSVANSNASGTTPWYKYTKTASGGYRGYSCDASIPIYLRAFVKWTSCSFVVQSIDDCIPGTVDKTSVTVPSEYAEASENGNELTVYGTKITATKNDGYKFESWECSLSSDRKTMNCIAKFAFVGFKMSFMDDGLCDSSMKYKFSGGTYNSSASVTFLVESNATINLNFLHSHSDCGSIVNKADCYAVMEVTFKGKLVTKGVEETTAKNYTVLIYVIDDLSDYYIESATVTTKNGTFIYSGKETISVTSQISFVANYKPREYGLGWY